MVKDIYYLNQALSVWYDTLSTFLVKSGFQKGKVDKILFTINDGKDMLWFKSMSTPMNTNFKIDPDLDGKSFNSMDYRILIGSLLYLIASYLDITLLWASMLGSKAIQNKVTWM